MTDENSILTDTSKTLAEKVRKNTRKNYKKQNEQQETRKNHKNEENFEERDAKKSEVEKAGGYLHWFYNEDSYLWARMYLAGCKFANIPENLVYARINEATFQRRGGYKYYKSERDLFKFMYKNKIIGWGEYQKAKAIRFVIQVLMPNSVRKYVFLKMMRKKPQTMIEEKNN